MKTLATILALSTVSSIAAAGGPPIGHWHMNANKEYPGDLFLVPVADHLCAYYRYDKDAAKPGGMTLEAKGDAVTGVWDEGIDTGKIEWKLAGKKLDGNYTDKDGKDPAPWVASFLGAGSTIKLEKTYDIDWDGGSGKSTIKVKQTGNKVVATVEGRYSGDADGTITGTLYGNVLAGVHETKNDDGTPNKGIVIMRFEKNLGSRTYNILDGLYSADLNSCSNGGLISGYQTK
jgi:hypothetical protein